MLEAADSPGKPPRGRSAGLQIISGGLGCGDSEIANMKITTRLAGLLVLLFTLSATAAGYETVMYDKHQAVANRVLARFKPEVGAAARATLMSEQRVRVTRAYSLVSDLVVLELLPQPGLSSVTLPDAKPEVDGRHLRTRIGNLLATGAFQYVGPDYVVNASLTPNDTAFTDGTLWGLKNTGINGGVAGADIGAEAAWDLTTGNNNIVVAVIDTGVNYLHQDLLSQMWINPGEIAHNGIDDDGDGYVDNIYGINAVNNGGDPLDDNGHGSHCAGTIGAAANNGSPHVGVAWNVRIMALKFLDVSGGGATSDAIECIQFARLNGARILSNSWGGGGFDQALQDAIEATRAAGLLFVAAAGNESTNNDGPGRSYPASYPVDNVISVAAVDRANNLAGFSNYGSQSVHLGAPGVAIFSSTHSTTSSYESFNGTSMACPHVSGAAVLLWARYPSATYAEIRQRLFVGTVPIASLSGKTATGGRLNVFNSLTVSPDNQLEIVVSSDSGLNVTSGVQVDLYVRVTDLFNVNNATVTGVLSHNGQNLTFLDNGTGADRVAGDSTYSASMVAPTDQSSFNLSVNATAPGKTAANANVTFTVTPRPSNDAFANRQPITTLPAILTASTLNATADAGEPPHHYNTPPFELGPFKTLWWTWTAPANGVYTLTTDGSSFDTILAVYTGSSLGTLTPIRSIDDAGIDWTSTVVFPASAGLSYHFVVDGYDGEAGNVQLSFFQNPPMANDFFANRAPIDGVNLTVSGHNVGSSVEVGEPSHDGFPPRSSVWWTWTPATSGTVTISTGGSIFDTILSVYTGANVGTLIPVASNDDFDYPNTLTSEVSFFANAGVPYQIAVSAFATGQAGLGNILLHLGRSPANNNFAGRLTLTGELAEGSAQTVGATLEANEPVPNINFPGSRSVWWTWTAPRSGNVTLSTDGSSFNTILAAYTGAVINGLSLVGENNDRVDVKIRTSLLSFAAVGGTTYQIQLAGVEDLSGLARLTLTLDARSQLSLPEFRSDGTTSIELLGEADRAYVLSSTSDFVAWTPIRTNMVVSRRVLFSEPTSGATGPRFYRARPASLVGGE